MVFSFDEKTQCEALDRTQHSLPLRPGRAGTMTVSSTSRWEASVHLYRKAFRR